MDFYNTYSQGFARVAACTHHAAIGDPAANAASVLRLARQCHDEGVSLAVFPELTLSGYSIEDILLQDVLLDTVEDAVRDIVAASADLLPMLVVGAPLRYRHRIYNTAVVIHRGAVLGVAPKSYLPTYREFYERRQIAPGDDERGTIRVAGVEAPFGPDLLFEASDVPGFVLHVEICEDMFVPIPPVPKRRWRVRRCWPTCPAARSRSVAPTTARCLRGRRHSAAWPPTCMPLPERESRPPTWRGTARPWSGRTVGCLRSRSGSPKASGSASPTSTSNCCVLSGYGWALSTTTGVTIGRRRSRSDGSNFGEPAGR